MFSGFRKGTRTHRRYAMKKQRILIVEDESIIALDIQKMLVIQGYEIAGIAESGEKAVSMAFEMPPDLILMDIVLKGPMDGIEASRIIRSRHDIPVIYLTANADAPTVERARDTQPYGYLNKPVSSRDLHTNIDSALHLTRMERHLRESEEKYRQLFELESDAIFMVEGETGRILEANMAASALYGYSHDVLLQLNISDLSMEAEKTARDLREKVAVLPLRRHRKKDGSMFATEATARHLDWQGRPIHILAVRDITERIRTQEALQKQRDTAQLYLDVVGVMIVAVGRDRKVILINRKGCEVLGYRENEIIGKDWFSNFIPERSRETVLEVFEHILNGRLEPAEYYENPVRIRSGEERIIAWHNTILRDETGMVISSLSSGEDITERKRAEELINRQKMELEAANEEMQAAYEEMQASNEEFEAINEELITANTRLAESEKRYRSLFEGIPIGLYRTTPEGKIIDANHALVTILGFPDGRSLLGVSSTELYVNIDDRNRFLEMTMEQKTVRDYEAQLRRYDGKIIWVRNNGRAVSDEHGRISFFEGSIEDITERRRTEEAIRTSEANYRAIFDNANDAIFIHDTETGAILDVNRKMTEMYGYTPDEARRIDVEAISAGEKPYSQEEAIALIQKAASDGPQIFEWRARNKTGDIFWVEVNLKRVNIGGSDRLMAIVRDISERKTVEEEKKRIEEQFRQSQKMESIGQLAGGIAHDFNNLLTAVTGNIALAQMNLSSRDSVQQHLDEAAKAVDSAAALIRQLLAFSRKQIIQPQVVNLNDLITEMQRMLVRIIGEDIELSIRPGGGPVSVKIDPGQFEQILVNLAVNARDAMPQGGKLTIETTVLDPDDEYRRTHADIPPGRLVLISISDTGSGMSDNVKKHLFEPFFTTKPPGKGTGLGLSTVYGSVKQSGGSIEVQSVEGGGTTFNIFLPVTAERPAGSAAVKSVSELPAGTETIFLVEDEDSVRKLVVTHLKRLGYTVRDYPGGPEAIAAAGSHSGPIHLLITDVVMPGMSGAELAKHISEILPGIKILFTSGYAREEIYHDGVLDKGIHFLSKPYTPLALARKVREVLDG